MFDLFSLFVFIWAFICHGIFPECTSHTLGSASHKNHTTEFFLYPKTLSPK